MGIEEILAALAKIEGVSQDQIAGIRKAYEGATNESKVWQSRASKAEESVNRLNELLGGTDKDAKKALETLQQQITDLTADRDKHKTEAETLKANIKEAEKLDAIATVASKSGIDRDGLVAMLKSGVLPKDKTAVKGEGDAAKIEVDGKDLKEYLKAYPYLERALVVTQDGQQTPPDNNQQGNTGNTTPAPSGQTPTGGTNSSNSNKNPVLGAIDDLGFAIPGASNNGNR